MVDACHSSALPGLVPTAIQHIAPIVEHEPMARDTWRMRVECPEMARQIVPGQFFMVRIPGLSDPLLGRPFALYDIYERDGVPAGIDFGYLVVGKMTSRLSQLRVGDRVELWGPLGNGFPVPEARRLMLIAGGIGQTPFLAVAREALGHRRYGSPQRAVPRSFESVSLCYGVRSSAYQAGVDEFRSVPGLELKLATDDGSNGHRGFVTDLLRGAIESDAPPDAVYCCGPEPMMHAAARLCASHSIACWLSLESPMACGFGACFSCVTKVATLDGWDYRRTCVEGPVFRADQLALGEH